MNFKNCRENFSVVRSHYDKSGRLVRVRKNNAIDSFYLYDQNSNRITGNAGKELFVAIYDNQDRLIRYNNKVYTYNANGDLLTKAERIKNSYKTTDYVYDVFGQLRKAGNISYGTNLNNLRFSKIVNGVVQKYFSYTPEGQLIGELDANMNLVKTFIFASKSHVPDYYIDQKGNSFKLITDHLGSIRLVVNASTGEVVQKMLHDEFGKVLVDTKPNATPFGFAGGLYDSETGLVRFGARDYDPETGRWTAKDPIRFEGGDSNLYGYVLTDPVNKIDPPGTGPVSGITCYAIDAMYTGSSILAELTNYTSQINAYQQGINDIQHQLKNLPNGKGGSCGDKNSAERNKLNSQLTLLKSQKNLMLGQLMKSLASTVGIGSVGGGIVCSGLLASPLP